MKRRNYIQEALTKAVLEALQDLDVIVPNMLDDGEKTSIHAELHYMPSESRPVTLGPDGDDQHSGILQVNIKDVVGVGTSNSKEKVAQLENIFTAGHTVWYNTTKVTIQRTNEEQSFRDGQWWVTPVTVYWYSRIKRGA